MDDIVPDSALLAPILTLPKNDLKVLKVYLCNTSVRNKKEKVTCEDAFTVHCLPLSQARQGEIYHLLIPTRRGARAPKTLSGTLLTHEIPSAS